MVSGPAAAMGDEGSRVKSIDDLAAMMHADGVRVQVDADRKRLQAANNIAGEAAALLINWDVARGAVQVIQVLPWQVPVERLEDAALAMIRANHESVLPAFGMNTVERVAYCRGVLPLVDGAGIEEHVIRALVATVTRIAREQGPDVAAAWRLAA